MNTVQYKCPNCGAELTFDPEHQNFSCEYCDSTYTEAEMQQLYQNMEQQADQQADASAETLESERRSRTKHGSTPVRTAGHRSLQKRKLPPHSATTATLRWYSPDG